ncbi:hypothetical protein ACFSCX_10960 [Bacillus salitolerans]|uniref:DUF4367 domain-containing protein n=1 Tax=Bacillus salitolerans TaxID=1437434 RepID=A0ABW4LPR3_9BACI
MKKQCLLLFCIILFFSNEVNARHQRVFTTPSNGLVSIHAAVEQFEGIVGKEVALPTKLPFNPTHQFGEIKSDNSLELMYVNDKKLNNLFMIIIKPSKKELSIQPGQIGKWIELKNGAKAIHKGIGEAYSIEFITSGLEYRLLITKDTDIPRKSKALLDAANSLQ